MAPWAPLWIRHWVSVLMFSGLTVCDNENRCFMGLSCIKNLNLSLNLNLNMNLNLNLNVRGGWVERPEGIRRVLRNASGRLEGRGGGGGGSRRGAFRLHLSLDAVCLVIRYRCKIQDARNKIQDKRSEVFYD